jgi:hypothetical protein
MSEHLRRRRVRRNNRTDNDGLDAAAEQRQYLAAHVEEGNCTRRRGKPGVLTRDDLELRREILAVGCLKYVAEFRGWPPSRLYERMRRAKQRDWWRAVKAAWAVERQRERWRRAGRIRRARAALAELNAELMRLQSQPHDDSVVEFDGPSGPSR